MSLSIEVARQLLRYDPDTGKLFWREHNAGSSPLSEATIVRRSQFFGKEAFTSINSNGYHYGCILGRYVSAHRLIWFLQTGKWPKYAVDHINGNKKDNRRENLRDATQSENMRNRRVNKNNTTGMTGVRWNKARRKWQATVSLYGKSIHLGVFNEKSDAIAARLEANAKYGFSERHGEYGPALK